MPIQWNRSSSCRSPHDKNATTTTKIFFSPKINIEYIYQFNKIDSSWTLCARIISSGRLLGCRLFVSACDCCDCWLILARAHVLYVQLNWTPYFHFAFRRWMSFGASETELSNCDAHNFSEIILQECTWLTPMRNTNSIRHDQQQQQQFQFFAKIEKVHIFVRFAIWTNSSACVCVHPSLSFCLFHTNTHCLTGFVSIKNCLHVRMAVGMFFIWLFRSYFFFSYVKAHFANTFSSVFF